MNVQYRFGSTRSAVILIILICLTIMGYLSSYYQFFPYQLLSEAGLAFRALTAGDSESRTAFENGENDSKPAGFGFSFWENENRTSPETSLLSDQAGTENILVAGCRHTYRSQSNDGYMAWIIDREGQVFHAWRIHPRLWADHSKERYSSFELSAYPIGIHLYENGDLLVNFQSNNSFPPAVGLARFDKDSRLLWKREGYYHHWFTVTDDLIILPSMKIIHSPYKHPDSGLELQCEDKNFEYETLVFLNHDGQIIKEIDLMDLLVSSDLLGLFNWNAIHANGISACDPLHLNDVRNLTPELAPAFPMFRSGDLLLSFRSLHTLAVLDKNLDHIKWIYTGSLFSQHSPRFLPSGEILVFDNLGNLTQNGITRIAAIDPGTSACRIVFPNENNSPPNRPFHSDYNGYLDISPDSKRMLAAFSAQGLLWEIDLDSGTVLWEYVNTHLINGRPARITLLTSQYVDDLNFPLNHGILPDLQTP